MNRWPAYLRLLRPPQWIKNGFCLAGVVFAGRAQDHHAVALALITFVAFCAISSVAYIINDLGDREADARHPRKRFRPLASGAVSPREAALLASGCLAMGAFCLFWLPSAVAELALIYMVINIAYSRWLKRVALIDVMLIAAGFLLRVFAGTAAVDVPTSAWILLCTFFLALFLGFAKRRVEFDLSGEFPATTRAVLVDYSPALLERFCSIFATLTIAAYAVFTTSLGRDHTLVLTCPPVVFGVLRLLYLIERREAMEQVEILLIRDRPTQAAIWIWLALHAWILYGGLRVDIQ